LLVGYSPDKHLVMEKSVFNTNYQQTSLTSKIVVGLERISEAFRYLLWEHAKTIGLSPIQIQILIFIAYHKNELCNVSYLAKEFNVTKPTISDAVKALEKKNLIIKDFSGVDSRSYTILLSEAGREIVSETEQFANPIEDKLETIEEQDLQVLYKSISKLIYNLNKTGIITVQRTCFNCKFYEKIGDQHHCHLLETDLFDNDIRLDCLEFENR